MIARVVVDVAARQTDRPFDYRVPEEAEAWIEVGSRVAVPFGGRTVQGFVVGFAQEAEVEPGRLKPIGELLDPTPPLRPDLIELARWMADTYGCTWTAAMQAMIPAALKGKAERMVSLAQNPGAADHAEAAPGLSDALIAWLKRYGPVKLTTLLERFPDEAQAVSGALRRGVLAESAQVRDRLSVKKILTVFPPEDRAAAEAAAAAFPARLTKQRQALLHMLERNEPVPLRRLAEESGFSESIFRALADKGLLSIEAVEEDRDPYAGRRFTPTRPLPLTDAQAAAYRRIAEALESGKPAAMLLQGVTGSGKTEVYLQAIERCIASGRQAIVLVPEIALTPQMVERFKGRFGSDVAVMHSRLSLGERYDEWRKVRDGRVRVAIGARSAVFAPFERIGLIIIDEEHESSYKQEESPKYHARDAAVYRAGQHGAVVVLGSATPSLESFAAARLAPAAAAAESGGQAVGPAARVSPGAALRSAEWLPLPERALGLPLPPVDIVDMREELAAGNRTMFSRRLREALTQRLERGEQTVLLLNRRGYSTFVMCRSCGYTAGCPHCEIALTYHQRSSVMRCHYCGHAERQPEECPACGSPHIRYFGTGTERVEEELYRAFPGIRVIRMDVDTTGTKGAHEKLLSAFGRREADVLLGTQMVAKGLDFPLVTLVGVIAADTSLHLPDFRAAERTFQLITQVAGRAGRHDLPGEVVVQTYSPDHYAIRAAQRHDYDGFVREELRARRLLSYPPFCRLALATLSHPELPKLAEAAERFAAALRGAAASAGLLKPLAGGSGTALELVGPAASPIPRLKDRYRWQVMIKYRGIVDAAGLIRQAAETLAGDRSAGDVQISVDVDPQVIL
ncbi:MAG: primosomal protein N' [Thermobacillus sp.]|uniref:primosomal protein N' n=1 Tax=Thermobacillus sp. TaxID=2108467 RepID=UPI000E3699C9|nr:primosomal protein N' [Thermobacillus sp.]REK58529.1 MAG: primosomal protein N' [Thermobacillus sp.]